jgi:hypothetical protein
LIGWLPGAAFFGAGKNGSGPQALLNTNMRLREFPADGSGGESWCAGIPISFDG